jgi:hypothetical protein
LLWKTICGAVEWARIELPHSNVEFAPRDPRPARANWFAIGVYRCVIQFSGPYRDLDVECETHIGGPWDDWVRLKYEMTDHWTGEPLKIDDKVYLATSRPHFGGLRWWFVCPQLNRRVRKLYLPLGGRHFWSRRAYELAYASQRETKYDRALRRARKLRLTLGGDPTDDEYPDKPPRMRWATYNRLTDRLVAADGVADERLKGRPSGAERFEPCKPVSGTASGQNLTLESRRSGGDAIDRTSGFGPEVNCENRP